PRARDAGLPVAAARRRGDGGPKPEVVDQAAHWARQRGDVEGHEDLREEESDLRCPGPALLGLIVCGLGAHRCPFLTLLTTSGSPRRLPRLPYLPASAVEANRFMPRTRAMWKQAR